MAFNNRILGRRIKACRQAAGISQEKVAELIDVSRQAVTKWEAGQSAPSTENLFKLAEIFGTTVDLILTDGAEDEDAAESADTSELRKTQKFDLRRNLRTVLLIAGVYAAYYLVGRVLCVHYEDAPVMGWLFLNDWKYIDYLYGWLLSSKLFWYAAAVSAAAALVGKRWFAAVTAAAFGIGWVLGELFGPNPEGAVLGHSHYGWAIWGGVFLIGVAAGVAVEIIRARKN
ncbi:MAG: helix-turn-helix transcriptional regulator [Firmicutes bacterium]|nr:helix-turn-helix transcriptional regulator [Bacillota bacterium]